MAVKKKKSTTKARAKKPAAKKTTARKTAAKKVTARKTAKPRTAAKRKTATKTAAKRKTTARKTTAKKTTARKTARKTPAKRTARKTTAKRTTTAAKSLTLSKSPITKKQTKAQIVAELHEATGVSKAEIKNLFAALRNIVERHMSPRGSGQFAIPEMGVKIRRVNKKATKARMGRNPFTGEEIKIPAKPARKAVRATVLKSLKEVV